MEVSRRAFFRTGLQRVLRGVREEASRAARPPRPERVQLGPLSADPATCFSALGNPCTSCVEFCRERPRPIQVRTGALPEVDGDQCTACGVCVDLCPASALLVAGTA